MASGDADLWVWRLLRRVERPRDTARRELFCPAEKGAALPGGAFRTCLGLLLFFPFTHS